jgi:hypothetical protein
MGVGLLSTMMAMTSLVDCFGDLGEGWPCLVSSEMLVWLVALLIGAAYASLTVHFSVPSAWAPYALQRCGVASNCGLVSPLLPPFLATSLISGYPLVLDTSLSVARAALECSWITPQGNTTSIFVELRFAGGKLA